MKIISATNGKEHVFEVLNLDIIKIYHTKFIIMYIWTNIKEKLWDEVQWCKGINITLRSKKENSIAGRLFPRTGQGSRSGVWLEKSNSAYHTRQF